MKAAVALRLIVVAMIAFQLPDVYASSDAGIRINVGKFRLNVYYSDAMDYAHDADKEIRDPRAALFDLAALVQANAGSLASVAHTVQAELYTRAGSPQNYLLMIEDPETKSVVLRDGPIVGGITGEVMKVVCERYADACKRPASGKVELYPCAGTNCPGQIQFGAFPSASVNNRFGLTPPAGASPQHTSVTRNTIGQYFETLDP